MFAPAPRGYQHSIPVTPDGYRRLREQLRSLIDERQALAAALREARAHGDPPEQIDGLLDEHLQLERRMSALQADVERARVMDGPARSDAAAIGTRVRLRPLDRDGSTVEYTLVSSVEADPELGRLSVESPVGAACVGRRPGDVIEVEAPAGRVSFELVAVERAEAPDRLEAVAA